MADKLSINKETQIGEPMAGRTSPPPSNSLKNMYMAKPKEDKSKESKDKSK